MVRWFWIADDAHHALPASSADAAKWELGTRDGKYKDYFRGLTFGNGTFMALGGDPGSVGQAKPFYLSYQAQDDRPLQEIYGRAIARIAIELHRRIGEHRALLRPNRDAPREPEQQDHEQQMQHGARLHQK